MGHKIRFDIAPDGTVKYEVIGIQGPGCDEASRWIDEKLGGKGLKRENKPEYFQEEEGVKVEN